MQRQRRSSTYIHARSAAVDSLQSSTCYIHCLLKSFCVHYLRYGADELPSSCVYVRVLLCITKKTHWTILIITLRASYLRRSVLLSVLSICVFACLQRAGGRCPHLTTDSTRSVCVFLERFFFIFIVSLLQICVSIVKLR